MGCPSVSHTLVKTGACFCEKGIIRRRPGDAGIQILYALGAKRRFKSGVQSAAESLAAPIPCGVDGNFRGPAVSGARRERSGIGVSGDLSVFFRGEPGICLRHRGDAPGEFRRVRHGIFESDRRALHIRGVYRAERLRVGRARGTDADGLTAHERPLLSAGTPSPTSGARPARARGSGRGASGCIPPAAALPHTLSVRRAL